MRRYELTDEQFELIRDLLPANGRRGGQWNDHRVTLNGLFWILHSGAQWREMPERYGKWPSVYDRFNRWRRDGTIDRILQRLQMRLDKDGRIDWDLWCIDGTNVRASRSAAGARGSKTARTTSRTTTGWAAAEAGGAASSTWLLTAREFR
jgi:transposase